MKVCMFHLMPYRDLPADFEQRYNSAYIDPLWFDVADAEKVGGYYNATLDELLHAANAGLHGVCTNQHHQNVYGFMANPSLMGAVLARQTNGQNVAIIQIGCSQRGLANWVQQIVTGAIILAAIWLNTRLFATARRVRLR